MNDQLDKLTKKELISKIETLQAQVVGDPESEGWIIRTPNPGFTDRRAGVPFTNGIAFLTKSKSNSALAVKMKTDFGYEVEKSTMQVYQNELQSVLVAALQDVQTEEEPTTDITDIVFDDIDPFEKPAEEEKQAA